MIKIFENYMYVNNKRLGDLFWLYVSFLMFYIILGIS